MDPCGSSFPVPCRDSRQVAWGRQADFSPGRPLTRLDTETTRFSPWFPLDDYRLRCFKHTPPTALRVSVLFPQPVGPTPPQATIADCRFSPRLPQTVLGTATPATTQKSLCLSYKSSNVTRGILWSADLPMVALADIGQCQISAKNSNENRRVLSVWRSRQTPGPKRAQTQHNTFVVRRATATSRPGTG